MKNILFFLKEKKISKAFLYKNQTIVIQHKGASLEK